MLRSAGWVKIVYRVSFITRKWLDALRRLSGRGTYPHEFAFLLLLSLRSLYVANW